jgi:uncharacterized membrane-anchored protein
VWLELVDVPISADLGCLVKLPMMPFRCLTAVAISLASRVARARRPPGGGQLESRTGSRGTGADLLASVAGSDRGKAGSCRTLIAPDPAPPRPPPWPARVTLADTPQLTAMPPANGP